MSTITTKNSDTQSGVVEYVITDDSSLNTAHVVHTIGGVTVICDGQTVYVPMTMLSAIVASMSLALEVSE